MTSRPSSTSSSSPGAYIGVFLGATLLLLACIATVAALGYRHGKLAFDFYDLYLFQREKVRATGPVDTVFVGDSSLGNALDARLWSERTGRPALNLALTGAYGYGGSLNMIRQVIDRQRPRQVVIMQTPDMLTRNVSLRGYLHTLGRLLPLDEVPVWVLLEAYLNLDTAIAAANATLFQPAPKRLDIGYDFVRQGRPLSGIPGFVQRYGSQSLRREMLNPEHLNFLRRIATLCQTERLDCMYAHGPILEAYCTNSAGYLEAANAMIESAGLKVLPGTPICMPLADAGDAEDHVRPERRAWYTESYLALLRKKATH